MDASDAELVKAASYLEKNDAGVDVDSINSGAAPGEANSRLQSGTPILL
jgi:hypothetical protein